MSVTSQQQQRKYPSNDKKVWGPQFWGVMHELAAEYPESPNRSDRIEYQRLYSSLIRHLPCPEECRPHAIGYLREKPLDFSSKQSLSRDLCEFHNHVNETTGKEVKYDCNNILAEGTCSSCKIGSKVSEIPDITETFESYKSLSAQIFSDLCKRDNIPVPSINFSPCPGSESTSCVRYKVGEQASIFLNPYSVSLRQVLHEYDHYRDYINGGRTFSEDKANTFAYQ